MVANPAVQQTNDDIPFHSLCIEKRVLQAYKSFLEKQMEELEQGAVVFGAGVVGDA